LATGEIRIATGPDFRGARLTIATPEARVEVTGTTLAVIREPAGTCVCVMQGNVRVGAGSGAMERIEAGRRIYVFNDGRPPERAEMRPTEVAPLGELMERHAH
jgi:ferric-dicitrate binding protein FerR (iron transport regulator)